MTDAVTGAFSGILYQLFSFLSCKTEKRRYISERDNLPTCQQEGSNMNKHSFFEHFSSFACLIAASAVLIVFLASCGREPEEQDSAPETSASVETSVVSATKTAPSANGKSGDGFVFPPEGLICLERVYYDASPTPDTVKVVYLRAPENAVDLVIPDGVTEIGSEAFHDCANLESVVFPNSVNMIPANAFYVESIGLRIRCPKLKSVVLPVHAAIGSYAFYGLQSLESVTLNKDDKAAAPPREDAAIGDEAFSLCRKLKEITIPEGVEAIGDSAFYSCRLERVSLPASLKTIGRHAFLNCFSLREIAIPNGVTSIAYDAFYGTPCKESVRSEMESRRTAAQAAER